MWVMVSVLVGISIIFWWIAGERIIEDWFDTGEGKFFNGLWLGALCGLILMLLTSWICTFVYGYTTVVVSEKPVLKQAMYVDGHLDDSFYLFQQPGSSLIYCIIPKGNGYETVYTDQDKVEKDPLSTGKYVKVKYVIKSDWAKYLWPLKPSVTKIVVPDTTIKFNFSLD